MTAAVFYVEDSEGEEYTISISSKVPIRGDGINVILYKMEEFLECYQSSNLPSEEMKQPWTVTVSGNADPGEVDDVYSIAYF